MKQIIIKRLKDFFFKTKHFSIALALYDFIWWICFYIRPPFAYKLSTFAIRKKTVWLDKYIGKHYSEIIERYHNNNSIQAPVKNHKIWVFWGQGESQMPPLVKACYRQLTAFNNNVVLLTNHNIKNYIHLSPIIYDKVTNKDISWAHFSDIIRTTLLANYGGLWLDATVWVSGKIPFEKLLKFSVFTANGKVPITNRSIQFWTSFEWNWSTWCLFSNRKQNILFSFVSEMLQAIAIQEKYWPDYVIQDYLIYYACHQFPEVRKNMEECNKTESKKRNHLATLMNSPWNENIYLNLIKTDFFFKLSFRTQWKKTTKNGNQTYYGHIISTNI